MKSDFHWTHHFHTRLLLFFTTALVIPLTVLTVFFVTTYNSIYNEKHQSVVIQESTDLSININHQFQSAMNYLTLISRNEQIHQCLNENLSDPAAQEKLSRIIVSYGYMKPEMMQSSLMLFDTYQRPVYGRQSYGSIRDKETFFRFVTDPVQTTSRNIAWFTDKQMNPSSADSTYFYLSCPIENIRTGKVYGYTVLRFRESSLISLCLRSTDEHTGFFVIDNYGNFVANADSFGVNGLVLKQHRNQLLMIPEKLVSGDLIIYSYKLANYWVLCAVTHAQASSSSMDHFIALYVIILSATIVLVLILAYFLAKSFVRPVSSLITQMDKVRSGDLEARVNIRTHDEFEQLADHYNSMISRINELIRQIVREQEEKKKSSILAYQTQIGPHFLMNTLTSMRYMIYSNGPADVDRMIQALNGILSYSLSNAGEYASINMELEQIRNYLTIQQFGFDEPLSYDIRVDDELGSCLIIKLLLQPLVENSVLHGLKLAENAPRLSISIREEDPDHLCIQIADNGAGFENDHIMEDIIQEKNTRIGLSNVYKRMQLHYGNDFSFDIASRAGNGTVVTIIIPRKERKDELLEDSDR